MYNEILVVPWKAEWIENSILNYFSFIYFQHYDTMDNLWGRPGGGAPKGYTMRKFNLDEIIHRPTHDVRAVLRPPSLPEPSS